MSVTYSIDIPIPIASQKRCFLKQLTVGTIVMVGLPCRTGTKEII